MRAQRRDPARLIAEAFLTAAVLAATAALIVLSLGYPTWPYGAP